MLLFLPLPVSFCATDGSKIESFGRIVAGPVAIGKVAPQDREAAVPIARLAHQHGFKFDGQAAFSRKGVNRLSGMPRATAAACVQIQNVGNHFSWRSYGARYS